MQKRVLITAANGMGPFVIKAFQAAGYEVFAIARNEERKQTALARNPHLASDHVLICDLASDEALTAGFWQKMIADYKIDGVVNNAMVTPKNDITKPNDKDQTRTYRVNTEMATALFEACAADNITVIQQSTDKAHIPNDKNDHYRQSKNMARISLQKLAAEKGLKGVVIEIAIAKAPGDDPYQRADLLAEMPLKLKMLQKKPCIVQPIDINDQCDGIVGMMQNLWENRSDLIVPGTVYQGAGRQSMTIEEEEESLRAAMGLVPHKNMPFFPFPTGLAEHFLRIAGKTPLSRLSPFDYFDMQELRRDFSATPEAVAAFMKAGNLTALRDPFEAYRRYAERQKPHNGLGAIFAMAGFDVERWLRSIKNEKWSGDAPPTAAAPAIPAPPLPAASRKRVLVTGATGFIGPEIVQELLAAGYEVVCAIHSPEKAKRDLPYPGLEFIKTDMNADMDPALWKERLKEYRIDTVINNAGIEHGSRKQNMLNINVKAPLALAEASRELTEESGKPIRFMEISTGFLTAKDYDSFPYPRGKKQVEDALAKMDTLDWVVVRPNYVYEPGRGHVLFEELVKLPILPFVNDGAKQPISNRDLALGVARLATPGDGASHSVLEAAGAETLGWRAMLGHVNEATHEHLLYTPRIPRILALSMTALNQALPYAALKKLAPFIKIDAATLQHVIPQTFRMLCAGTNTDPADWIRHTGITPSGISEVYRAWHEGPAAYAALYEEKRKQRLTAASRSAPAAGATRPKRSVP